MQYQAIVLAAGDSNRSKLAYNKVLYKIDGTTIIYKAATNFLLDKRCNKVFLVCKETEIDIFKEIFAHESKISYVIGGKTRQSSVNNALKLVDCENVLIHDGARPNYSKKLLDELVDKLSVAKAIIPVIGVTDTIKVVKDGKVVKTLDRNELRSVQTPQAFNSSTIKLAHSLATNDLFTDDASLIEKYTQEEIYVIDGEVSNVKYTVKEDF